MKKLAIFDFDGTLFDSVHDVIQCLNTALSINGFPILTHEEYLHRLGGNVFQIISLILKDKDTPENVELIKKDYEKLYDESPKSKTVPFPNLKDILLELQEKGILLAINSNRSTESIKYFVDRYLDDIDFVLIEGHNLDYPSKPSPNGVNKIIEKANVTLDEVLYIGDSSTDIKTAKNAGIDCILVKWGYGFSEDYSDEYVLETLDDPFKIIEYFKK